MTRRPRLLMVMPYQQLVRKAQAEGFWVAAIWDPSLETAEYLAEVRALADVFVLTDFGRADVLSRTIRDVAEQHEVSLICHLGREESMITTAEVAEELWAEPNPTAAVRLLTDKLAMREHLARHRLSTVAFAPAGSRADVPEALARIGYPAVVKPTSLAGSRAVFLCRGPEDLPAWTRLVDDYDYPGPFLVEEYLDGPEFSVETLSQDGRHQVVGITQKQLGPAPLFVEVGHVHPAPLPPERARAIEDLTLAFLTVCGYRSGPAHTEVIWTAAGPRIVESQARLGGDRIPRLIGLSSGLDIEQAVFAGLAGRPIGPVTPTATAMVRFFTFPPGRVEEVRGVEAARRLEYVDELVLRLAPGDTVRPVTDSKGRHGHVIVSAATAEQAQARCAEVISMIDVVMAPQVLFVGYNAAYLRAIEGRVPTGSVVVLEEPDIIRKRRLETAASGFDCLDRIVPVAYQQSSAILEAGAELAAGRGVAAVVPGLEYAVPAAAALAAKLGLPGAGEAAAQTLRDKLRLREVSSAGGVRNPRWREAHGPDDVVDFAAGGPVVVKPANRQASVGVVLMDAVDPDSAAKAWARTSAAAEYEQVPDRALTWRYLVEERLRGPEYSVEALVRRGQVIFENVTAKTVIPGPFPVELGHLVPAPLSAEVRAAFASALRSLIGAIGFETGILHAEMILTEAGPVLVECAGRCPGDHLIDLIDLAYDTRIRLALIDLLADRPVALPRTSARAGSIRFLQAPPGTVAGVAGLEAARHLPGVQDVEVDLEVGAQSRVWTSSWDRAGHVIATGPDQPAAEERVRAAAATVQILTTQPDQFQSDQFQSDQFQSDQFQGA